MAEFTSLNGFMVKDATARSIAKGRNQAVAYSDYATMIEALNEMEKEEFKTGQNIYIGTVGVPDLWVYAVESIRHTFTYVSDENFAEMLKENTTVQVGFFKLAMLEGQKVDLTTVNAQLAEMNEEFHRFEQSFQDGCSTIAAAITSMGIETEDNASPETMAANIEKLRPTFVSAGDFELPRSERDYYGQYAHRYTLDLSSIPNIEWMTLNQDFFVCISGIQEGQNGANMWLMLTYMDRSNGKLYYKSNNFVDAFRATVYYNEKFTP